MDGTRGRFRGPRATGGAGLTDGCDEARLIPQRMPWVGSVAEEREIHCERRQERKRAPPSQRDPPVAQSQCLERGKSGKHVGDQAITHSHQHLPSRWRKTPSADCLRIINALWDERGPAGKGDILMF